MPQPPPFNPAAELADLVHHSIKRRGQLGGCLAKHMPRLPAEQAVQDIARLVATEGSTASAKTARLSCRPDPTSVVCCDGDGDTDNEGFAAEPEGWRWMGAGRGSYEPVQTYEYVGEGSGDFEKKEVVLLQGYKVRPCCLQLLAALLVVLALCLLPPLLMPTWHAEPCTGGRALRDEAKRDYCCERFAQFCERVPAAGITSTNTTAPATSGPPLVLPQPLLPPASPQAVYPSVAQLPSTMQTPAPTSRGTPALDARFNCTLGLAAWESLWSVEKSTWCCAHAGNGCAHGPEAWQRR